MQIFKFKGVFHVIADAINNSQKFLFSVAPFFSFIAAFAVFALIPIAAPIGDFQFQVTDVKVFGGWSTDSKYGLLGSVRASAQLISYEIFLGLLAGQNELA